MKIAVIEPGTALRSALAGALEADDELVEGASPDDFRPGWPAASARVLILDWTHLDEATRRACRELPRGGVDRPSPYLIAVVDPPDPVDQLAAFDHGVDSVVEGPPEPGLIRARLDVARRSLRREDELRSRSAALEALRDQLEAEKAELAEMAARDPLTSLPNRRSFREAIDAQWSLSRRRGEPLSLVMIDVDQFKAFNDQFGHLAGDDALREVAAVLRSSVRECDFAARYGGEEFVILFPATSELDCRNLVERLRLAVVHHPWPLRPITISLGVATLQGDETPAELIEQADRSLYISKALGRNRVTHAREAAGAPSSLSMGGQPDQPGPLGPTARLRDASVDAPRSHSIAWI